MKSQTTTRLIELTVEKVETMTARRTSQIVANPCSVCGGDAAASPQEESVRTTEALPLPVGLPPVSEPNGAMK